MFMHRPAGPPDTSDVQRICEVCDFGSQTDGPVEVAAAGGASQHHAEASLQSEAAAASHSAEVATLQGTVRRKDEVIVGMQKNLVKVEQQLVVTQTQLQGIENDVLQRLSNAEQTWTRRRRQLHVDLASERAVSQTLHAAEGDLGEQLRKCRRRCAELDGRLSERQRADTRGQGTSRRRRSRRLAALCQQLSEHVARLQTAQTKLSGELLSTLQTLFGIFNSHSPDLAPPCDAAVLTNMHLWLPWLTAEAKVACRARQRHLPPGASRPPSGALASPPPDGAPPHLAALVSQVWTDIARLRQVDVDVDAELERVDGGSGDGGQ